MEHTPIRLLGAVNRPGRSGPFNGQYALQRALRAAAPEWLAIGGSLKAGEIPWYWSWGQRRDAAARARASLPFIAGPNVLFDNSGAAGKARGEREVLDASCCRLLFCHNEWYRQLILAHMGPANRAPVVRWYYPVDPPPGPPLESDCDLLIFVKSGASPKLIEGLKRLFPCCLLMRYGKFERSELYEAARRSRSAVYLSGNDSGAMALAEITLAGCPAVALRKCGECLLEARTGTVVERLTLEAIAAGLRACRSLDRGEVCRIAREHFSPARVAATIIAALETAAAS